MECYVRSVGAGVRIPRRVWCLCSLTRHMTLRSSCGCSSFEQVTRSQAFHLPHLLNKAIRTAGTISQGDCGGSMTSFLRELMTRESKHHLRLEIVAATTIKGQIYFTPLKNRRRVVEDISEKASRLRLCAQRQ